ncbi:MAG TPA: hypothetical protein VFW98_17305 [Gemmatimonadaceae bacterium]|nr:hypothetical protein [Gemmatimonadaceae bacterium]
MQRRFQSPDGLSWRVEVRMPGASNAMVVFHHPDGITSRRDRYNWYNADTAEARSVTARLDPDAVLKSLSDADLARLFRRSMPISANGMPLYVPASESDPSLIG